MNQMKFDDSFFMKPHLALRNEIKDARNSGIPITIGKRAFAGDYKHCYGLCNSKVYVNAKYGSVIQLAVLYHELTHFYCRVNDCKCRRSEFLSEYHAFRNTLKMCMINNHIRSLRFSVASMTRLSRNKDWPQHAAAIRKLMKTKLWKNAKKLITSRT